jgi:hypothetical protein
LRNRLGDGANNLIQLSGLVDQIVGLLPQSPGLVFAGPESGYCGTGNCPPQSPTFRLLTLDDIPVDDLASDGGFVIQKNVGLDLLTANIAPNNFALGMISMYAGSGSITYDSGILFDYNNNRLLVGGDASTDTPVYTLDARGTIGSQSGYLNQLLFTDGLVRIGNNAGTNNGNLTENFYIIDIGNNSGGGASGNFDVANIGRFAGLNSQLNSGVALVGVYAGNASTNLRNTVALGSNSLNGANNVVSGVVAGDYAGSGLYDSDNIIAVGPKAGYDGSGINSSTLIGYNAAIRANDLTSITTIGNFTLADAVNLNNAIVIGSGAGSSSNSGEFLVILGDDAGGSIKELRQTIGIGESAANQASGEYNIYIGHQAGLKTSGNLNIELVSSGVGSESWLGSTANNKLNIQRTITGDTSTKKISIGNPSGIDPIATLMVEPADVNDNAFIIRVVDSGSASNPVELQSGDGTTFYAITNSGDVDMAGWLQPSGGLWLPPSNPTRNSGQGGYMLWNDMNTLTWNGAPVGGAGSFTSWTATTQDTTDAVTDGQAVTFSGVSGIDITNVGGRKLIFDGAELSGICVELSGQIVASNYSFVTFASGVGSNNNTPKTMDANSVFAISGVSGINLDFTNLTDGTNSSGIYTVGYDITNTYSFNVTNGDVVDDIITNTETVTVSGVSGIRVEFEDVAGGAFFRIGASGLSGVLQNGIDGNTGYLSNEFGPISVSGVSGVATWASGEFSRVGIGSEGTSGIKLQNDKYIMDPQGSGNLRVLNFQHGIIRIEGSADLTSPTLGSGGNIAIGSGSCVLSNSDSNVVCVGTKAMNLGSNGSRSGTIAIGHYAAGSNQYGDNNYQIAVGSYSLYASSGDYNIGIGANAGNSCLGYSNKNISIGYYAGASQDGNDQSIINIGDQAGYSAVSGGYNINLGRKAGAASTGGGLYTRNMTDGVNIGRQAGFSVINSDKTVFIGRLAGYSTSGIEDSIAIGTDSANNLGSNYNQTIDKWTGIGYRALYYATDVDRNVAIGSQAGYKVSGIITGSPDNVFIGSNAGYYRGAGQSFIVSNRSFTIGLAGGTNYDANWCPHNEESIIDICHSIQGKIFPDTVNLHLGQPLGIGTLSEIQDSTVCITGDDDDDTVLLLRPNSASQAASYFETKIDGGGFNEVINSDGFLRLPRVTSSTGSYPNVILTTDVGHDIEPEKGVVCVYDIGANKGIAVAIYDTTHAKYVWYKIPLGGLF